MPPWRQRPDGVDLAVKAQPRAKRPAVGGLSPDGGALRVAVAEAAEDGRANRAIGQALAKALGVTPSAVDLLQGGGSRQKVFRIAGDPAALIPKLEKLIA